MREYAKECWERVLHWFFAFMLVTALVMGYVFKGICIGSSLREYK